MNESLLDDLEHEKLKKADFNLRLRATFLDGILLLIFLSFFALFLFLVSYAFPIITFDVGMMLFASLCFLYNPLMESSKSQGSIGKQVFNLKVVDKKEQRLSFVHALIRFVAKILSFALFFVGFIMIGFSDKKEGLHDMIARTSVVNTQNKF